MNPSPESEYRKTVDLKNYKTIIEDSIHQVAPDAVVTVYKDRYTITPDLSKGQLIKIGRLIAQTTLGQYCMIRPILFKGEVIEDNEDYELSEDDTKRKVATDNDYKLTITTPT